MMAPTCIFSGNLDRARSYLPTPSAMEKTNTQEEKRTKDKQEKKERTFPTKMTKGGSCGSLWHLLLMDGRLLPFCARGPCHHPQTRRAWPGTHAQHQQMDSMSRVGRPARPPLPRPLPPATSSSLGDLRWWSPPTVFAKDRVLEAVLAEEVDTTPGAGSRGLESTRSSPALALLGTDCHRYFGTPGRVLRQPPPQPSGPLSLRTSFGRTHLYAICPQPHPGMRGLAAPHPRPPPLTHGKYQHFEKQRWGSRVPHAEAPGGGRCH